jgi:hypothetical protein
MRVCHPEPASFGGEGSAVRNTAKEKADSSPRSKTERGSEGHIFEFFRSLLEPATAIEGAVRRRSICGGTVAGRFSTLVKITGLCRAGR